MVALEQGTLTAAERAHYQRDVHGQWRRYTLAQDGTAFWERYCRTCHIWRAPRVSHCPQCGFCMVRDIPQKALVVNTLFLYTTAHIQERFDHHCHIMATCIARRNHRFFVAFLLTAQAACIALVVGIFTALAATGFPGDPSVWHHPATYAYLALGILYGYHAIMLLFGNGHCLNVLCDVTTKECMAHKAGQHPWPCSSADRLPLLQAWRAVCCAPMRFKWLVGRHVDGYLEDIVQAGQRGGNDVEGGQDVAGGLDDVLQSDIPAH